jgi:Na+/melibiose symporter-like transporter
MCYGVWWLVTKISEALALAAVSYILTGFGYWTNIEQSDRALLGIRLFFGLVSSVFFFLSVPLLFRYSITRKSHAEIRRCLEAIETVGAAGDDELVRTL